MVLLREEDLGLAVTNPKKTVSATVMSSEDSVTHSESELDSAADSEPVIKPEDSESEPDSEDSEPVIKPEDSESEPESEDSEPVIKPEDFESEPESESESEDSEDSKLPLFCRLKQLWTAVT
jgi:hypothetical protein